MTKAVVLGVLVLTGGLWADHARAGDRVLFYTLGAGDALSTEHALKLQGAREMNPLLRNRGVRIGSQVVFAEGSTQLLRVARPRHPKLAKVLKWGLVAFKLGVIAHNEKIALQVRF